MNEAEIVLTSGSLITAEFSFHREPTKSSTLSRIRKSLFAKGLIRLLLVEHQELQVITHAKATKLIFSLST